MLLTIRETFRFVYWHLNIEDKLWLTIQIANIPSEEVHSADLNVEKKRLVYFSVSFNPFKIQKLSIDKFSLLIPVV